MGEALKPRYIMTALLAVLVFLTYFDIFYFGGAVNNRPWYMDMVMHVLGGGFIAAALLSYKTDLSPLRVLVLVLVVALGWEIFEYFVNIFVGSAQDPVSDTVSDLVLGLTGAALAVFSFREKRV